VDASKSCDDLFDRTRLVSGAMLTDFACKVIVGDLLERTVFPANDDNRSPGIPIVGFRIVKTVTVDLPGFGDKLLCI